MGDRVMKEVVDRTSQVLVLDFGSQYTHLITRRIRKLSVSLECLSGTTALAKIKALEPKVIMLSGGPHRVHKPGAPFPAEGFLEYAVEEGIPVLGIYYSFQFLVQMSGGLVQPALFQEYGRIEIFIEPSSALYGEEQSLRQTVWMSHGDEVVRLSHGFDVVARSLQNAIAVIKMPSKKIYGLQ